MSSALTALPLYLHESNICLERIYHSLAQTTGLPDETQGAQLSLNFRQGTSNNSVHVCPKYCKEQTHPK